MKWITIDIYNISNSLYLAIPYTLRFLSCGLPQLFVSPQLSRNRYRFYYGRKVNDVNVHGRRVERVRDLELLGSAEF